MLAGHADLLSGKLLILAMQQNRLVKQRGNALRKDLVDIDVFGDLAGVNEVVNASGQVLFLDGHHFVMEGVVSDFSGQYEWLVGDRGQVASFLDLFLGQYALVLFRNCIQTTPRPHIKALVVERMRICFELKRNRRQLLVAGRSLVPLILIREVGCFLLAVIDGVMQVQQVLLLFVLLLCQASPEVREKGLLGRLQPLHQT